MDEVHIQSYIFPSLVSIFFLISITRFLRKPSGSKNRPPSPPKLPILGNLHQLGLLPHEDLSILARKYGPLMLLHFGSVPVLIASSAQTAREIMKTHDVIFADRPKTKIQKICFYDGKDVAFAPYGDLWRQGRGHFALKLLNSKRVQSFRCTREEETALFVERVGQSAGPVNLSEMFSQYSNDGIFKTAFGRKFGESENGKKFRALVIGLSEVVGAIDIGEYIPWLSWISRLNGLDAKIQMVAEGLDKVMEGVIEERLQVKKEQDFQEKEGENFVDIMLDVYSGDVSSNNRDRIKGIILDALAAGTETTPIVLEWTMTELMRHPPVMEKLQSEIREIVKDKHHMITDDDLEKMHYLKAVIKEGLRYHPPFPLLLPRSTRENVSINGYDISAGTLVMVNAWAIGRDPVSWDEPEKFKPERFLNSPVDFKGSDFELIPFGAGRRGCPGIMYSMAMIELLLANLMHKFNWKLPNGAEGKDLDMTEKPGITIRKAIPLLALATKAK